MRKVLIVDDEPSIRFVLARTCERAGVPFEEAGSAEEARRKLGDSLDGFGLVLLDIRLPGDDGFQLLGELTQRSDSPFVVVMTAEDTMRSAVEAMKRGAADYLGKPFDLARVERIVKDLSVGPEMDHLVPPEQNGRADARAHPGAREDERRNGEVSIPDMLIGRSPAMVEVFKEIGRVARTEMTVLLMGESGTGKELVARAIHANSARARGPFVTVNMAAIPRDLMESELYGHEKGSFTGAVERRPGKFELASGGTLFLDEIGEMPVELQAKLLRVLQEREVDRVGGSRPMPVDVRIVATSNRDLGEMVRRSLFRSDLYYRLDVFPIVLPPLRERPEDLPALAAALVADMARDLGRAAPALDADALAALRAHSFPGNVRELRNLLERALVRCRGPVLGMAHLRMAAFAPVRPTATANENANGRANATSNPTSAAASTTHFASGDLPLDLGALERLAIAEALRRVGGNRTHAARLLGIGLRTLRNKLRAYREAGADVEAAEAAARQLLPGADDAAALDLQPWRELRRARLSQEEAS